MKPGDIIYFLEDAQVFGDGSFRSKAIDDRFGCALLLELIGQDLPYDTVFSFVVQEEVGLRGAGVAAAAADPEFALIFEATTAADLPGSEGADRVCTLGGGAVISFIDGRTVYDKALYDLAVQVSEKHGIRWQTKTKIAGGNDAGAIQNAGRGARVLAVAHEGNRSIFREADDVLTVPVTDPLLVPVIEIIPLQLFAYYVAKENGCDIDKPKNLAKSVTVE